MVGRGSVDGGGMCCCGDEGGGSGDGAEAS